jgi:hypothetical protein
MAIEYLWFLCRIADFLKDGRLACIRSADDENTKAVCPPPNLLGSTIIVCGGLGRRLGRFRT